MNVVNVMTFSLHSYTSTLTIYKKDFYNSLYYFEIRVILLDLTVENVLYNFFYQDSIVVYLGIV
jgi:hypothetical protein